jgi:SNF2 family DNA or RNA helicase
MQGTAAPAHFRARLVGPKIRIDAPASSAIEEFLHTLPSCRWDKRDLCWKCDATPAAAWRLLYGDVRFSADEPLHALAAGIQEAQILGSGGPLSQPGFRKNDLWKHQLEAFRFAHRLPAAMLHVGMGGGKSCITVALAANKGCRKVLILCPKSVIGVWLREFDRHCVVPHKVVTLTKGTAVDKAKLVEKEILVASTRQAPHITIFVVNYETAKLNPLLEKLIDTRFDCVVCDESQRIGAHNSQQSKAAAQIGATAKYRLCLTGTPMHNSPLDVFGQFRFLDPGVFGTKWHAFRSRYANLHEFGGAQIVKSLKNQDELAARMRLLTYHADRSVLDLPPVQHITVPVTLGPETLRVYRALEQEMIAGVADEVVTVSNALVKMLRLRQITGGFVQTDDDGSVGKLVETGHEKRDALVDLLEGMDAPCVVFCEFVHDLDQIADAAMLAGRKYGEVSGRCKDLTEHATMPEGIEVMGVQVRSGGIGVDLTRAPYGVYWNHPWSPGTFDQSTARIHRPGQEKPVVYYHLIADGTVDTQVWDALEKKQNVIDMVISYMRGVE